VLTFGMNSENCASMLASLLCSNECSDRARSESYAASLWTVEDDGKAFLY
jgi:hypothetical protein